MEVPAQAGSMYSIQEAEVDETGSLPGTAPLSQIIRPEEPLEADFSFARDRGAVNDLRTLVEQVAAEHLSRLERRVKSLEEVPAQTLSGSPRVALDSPARGSQAVQLRDHDLRLAKLSKDLHIAAESHRLQILKVTQAVGELGRELTSRVERIESAEVMQNDKSESNNDKLIEEEYRACTAELFAVMKQHGNSLSKQEIAMSALREDLKHEQRIRKDELIPKLKELAARPVRPEEQSISDLRQSVMSVREECSKLRAECRRLSSEVTSRDSEGLSRVLRQLSDMRNLLDNNGVDETVRLPVSLGKVNAQPSKREVGEGTKSGRISPVRDRTLQVRQDVRSASAKKIGRGNKSGDLPKAEDQKIPLRKRADDISQVASMGTTPLTLDTSQKGRSKSLEGLRSEEAAQPVPSEVPGEQVIMRPTLDARLQAAVAAVVQVPQPKAVALPQGITEIASARAGSPQPVPGPLLFARNCVVNRQTSPPLGRHPSQAPHAPLTAATTAASRISPVPGSCHVMPVGYRPAPRPMLQPGQINL